MPIKENTSRGADATHPSARRGVALYGVPPGTFTAWKPLPENSDLLFYEGLHGAVVTDKGQVGPFSDPESISDDPGGTIASPVIGPSGEVLVVFQGPHAYISPSWYPTKRETAKVVPTWNYAVVHAYGAVRFIDDRAWLDHFAHTLRDLGTHRRDERDGMHVARRD